MVCAQETAEKLNTIAAWAASDAANEAYWKAKAAAETKYEALPDGNRKESAYENAMDMIGEKLLVWDDQLAFFRACVGSYDFA